MISLEIQKIKYGQRPVNLVVAGRYDQHEPSN